MPSPTYSLANGAKVFDAGAMNFGGTADLLPVRQIMQKPVDEAQSALAVSGARMSTPPSSSRTCSNP